MVDATKIPDSVFLKWCETHITGPVQDRTEVVARLFAEHFPKFIGHVPNLKRFGIRICNRYAQLSTRSHPNLALIEPLLLALYDKYGPKWTLIGRHFNPPIMGSLIAGRLKFTISSKRVLFCEMEESEKQAYCAMIALWFEKNREWSWERLSNHLKSQPTFGIGNGPEVNELKMFCTSPYMLEYCQKHRKDTLLLSLRSMLNPPHAIASSLTATDPVVLPIAAEHLFQTPPCPASAHAHASAVSLTATYPVVLPIAAEHLFQTPPCPASAHAHASAIAPLNHSSTRKRTLEPDISSSRPQPKKSRISDNTSPSSDDSVQEIFDHLLDTLPFTEDLLTSADLHPSP